jgi:RNA polymerase sigma-70 factor, ECF subfamily
MNAPEPDSDALDRSDMRRLADGHDACLSDLMERHGARVFHYLVRHVQSEEDAADLAQETFVRVYRNSRSYDPRQRFSSWLYTIATNLARDRFKWRSRHPEVSLDKPLGDSDATIGSILPDPQSGPDAELLASERADAVRRAIQTLPEELRAPLIMAEYENMAAAEIAAVLDCTPKAVETRLYRARKQLRSALEKWLSPEGERIRER